MLTRLTTLRGKISAGKHISLLDLLLESWDRNASDPRDRIFALLGLATDAHPIPFAPDYNKSPEQVYKSTVKETIERDQNLDVLTYTQFNNKNFRVPSWCPDWTIRKSEVKLSLHSLSTRAAIGGKPFRCAGKTFPAIRFSEEFDVLYAQGLRVDYIRRTTGAGVEVFPRFDEIYRECLSLSVVPSEEGSMYFTGLTWRAALRQTLLCGTKDPLGFKSEFDMSIGLVGRKIFSTKKLGLIGLGPNEARENDMICILLGGRSPFVLRRAGDHCFLVGEAYGKIRLCITLRQRLLICLVHGIMYTDPMDTPKVREMSESNRLPEFAIW